MRPVVRAAVLATLVASCQRSAHDPELTARIAALEAKVAEQDRQLAAARSSDASPIELTALAATIDALAVQLNEIQDRIAKGGIPPKRRAPDPAVTYAFPLGTSPALGAPDAKVTMVMAFEFACRYCRRAWDTVDALRKRYGNDLRVVYKQYVVHPKLAMPAANAACAAHKQGKWRAMVDLLWSKAFGTSTFEQAHIDRLAKQARLDMKRYAADIAGPCPAETREDQLLLKRFAASGTPTFFINGRYIAGAKDEAEFATLIDEELAKARAAIDAGVQPDKLYESQILGKGATEVPGP